MEINNIKVNNPIIMNTETETKTVDLTTLSAQQLRDELAKRAKASQGKKDSLNELKDENIPVWFDRLKIWSEEGVEIKASIYEEIKTMLELTIEVYEGKTDQKSYTFTDTKGQSIVIGYNENAGYSDDVYYGVAKVKQFINSLIDDEKTAKLVNQINRLLRPDKKGNLDPKRILELRQMTQEYNNVDFIEGVEIIEKAYNPKLSSWYIKSSFKNNVGIEQNLPLSMSSIPFPEGFDLSFLLPEAVATE